MTTSRCEEINNEPGYAEAIWDVIARSYARLKGGKKILAQVAGASPNTAQNWISRRNAPNGEQLAALMAADPAFEDAFLELVRQRRRKTAILQLKVNAGNAALRASIAAGSVRPAERDRRLLPERRGSSVADRPAALMAIAMRTVSE